VRAAFVVVRRRVVVVAVGGGVARGAQRRLERDRLLGVTQDAEKTGGALDCGRPGPCAARTTRRAAHASRQGDSAMPTIMGANRDKSFFLARAAASSVALAAGAAGAAGAARPLSSCSFHQLIAVDRDAQQARVLEQRNQRARRDERERVHLTCKVGREECKPLVMESAFPWSAPRACRAAAAQDQPRRPAP
jgi:hypothetical protein